MSGPDPTEEISLDRFVGPYLLRGELGRGGMGVVYEGWDPRLKRSVALKVLPERLVGEPALKERFEREAQAMASVIHQNVALIYGIEECEGRTYLVLECVPGTGLEVLVGQGALPIDDVFRIGRQVGEGLAAVHARGLIHRDLKPANVKITPDGDAKVLDFGLAKALQEDMEQPGLTAASLIIGTPGFMSPEQLRGEELDERTDVFAWGCLLFECLTSELAFPGKTTGNRIAQTLEREPDWSLLPPDLPESMISVLRGCLQKDLRDRTPSMTAAVTALDGVRQAKAEPAATRAKPQRRARGDHQEAVQLAPAASLGHLSTLTRHRTSFVGREAELEEVASLLASGTFVTLTGMGGCGKSRLAFEVALRMEMPDGACVIPLAALSDADLLAHEVAKQLGVSEEPGQSMESSLIRGLTGRRILLVFDDCEHLRDACAELVDGLLSVEGVLILATSREPLGVEGEELLTIGLMDVPELGAGLDALEEVESVRLFVERAAAIKRSFRLDARTAPHVAAICNRLEGLPLALELAAARLKLLSPQQLATRLEDGFRVVSGGSKRKMARHQTLEATLEWSWTQLEEQERILLRRLGVFAGGWRMDGAERVCADDLLDDVEVLDVMSALLDKSLIQVDSGEEEPRYRLLNSVRQHALQKLEEAGELDVFGARHRDVLLADLLGAPHDLDRLAEETENTRTALSWSSTRPGELLPELEMVVALRTFWEVRGQWAEGRLRLSDVLSRARHTEPSELLARAWTAVAALGLRQGQLRVARDEFQQSLKLSEQLGYERGIAVASANLAAVAQQEGDLDEASVMAERGMEAFRRLSDEEAEAKLLMNLAMIASQRNELARARSLLDESISLRRKNRDERGVAAAQVNLSAVALEQGDFVGARESGEEALAANRRLGQTQGVALASVNLGLVARREGKADDALAFTEEALRTFRELGDARGVGRALVNLAELTEDEEPALDHYREAGTTLHGARDRVGLGALMVSQAKRLRLADTSRAARLLGAALSLGAPADEDVVALKDGLRESLGEEPLTAALGEGEAMDEGEALQLVTRHS